MKRYKPLSGFVFLCLFVCAAAPPFAQAQAILEQLKKPLPDKNWEVPPQEEFENNTVLWEEEPSGDATLAYSVNLPEEWKKAGAAAGVKDFTLNSSVLGEVARYYGPPRITARSRLVVESLGLEYQLTAEQWFLQYVMARGYTVEGVKTISDRRVEGLFILVEQDTTFVVRAIAELSGKRMILARYYLPTDVWEEEKIQQAQVIRSFKLLNPSNELVEEMEAFHFLDIAEFKYPRSWRLLARPIRSVDRIDIELQNVATMLESSKRLVLNGKIKARLVSGFVMESLEVEVQKLEQELGETGLVMGALIEERDDFSYDEMFEFANTRVYKAIDGNNSLLGYEFWVTIMAAEGYYYFITLLTPSRDDDFLVWSRNSQTYKLVVQLLEPQAESLAAPD